MSDSGGTVEQWESMDGTRWLSDSLGWSGWLPGEDGLWFMTEKQFRTTYGTEGAPAWPSRLGRADG